MVIGKVDVEDCCECGTQRLSKSCNLEEEKHGDDLNKYKTLGMAKE